MFAVDPQDKENVAFLYVEERVGDAVYKKPIGTCFFVTVWNHDHSIGHSYLVTAKHVWQWFRTRKGYVRVNKTVVKEGESGVDYRPLYGEWKFHPTEQGVDLAVLPWGDPQGVNYTIYSFDLAQIVPRPLGFDTPETFRWPPPEGALVYYIGLLPQYHGIERNFPIVRTGHLALVTDESVEGAYGLSSYHFIDLHAYKLHSGGPVWIFYKGANVLLGVLVAADPLMQELLQRKNVDTSEDVETVAYYNFGVSFVTPTSKLIEILESQAMKDDRAKAEPKQKKPEPLSADEEPLTKKDFEGILKQVSRKTSEPESKDSETSE